MVQTADISSIIEIIQNPSKCFRTLKNIIYESGKTSGYFTDNRSINFFINRDETPYRLRVFTLPDKQVSETIQTLKIAEQDRRKHLTCGWYLKDEIISFDIHNSPVYHDIALYELTSGIRFTEFLQKSISSSDIPSLLRTGIKLNRLLAWLLRTGYTAVSFSLDKLIITPEGEVLIDINRDILLKTNVTETEKASFLYHLAGILATTWFTLFKIPLTETLLSLLNNPAQDTPRHTIHLLQEETANRIPISSKEAIIGYLPLITNILSSQTPETFDTLFQRFERLTETQLQTIRHETTNSRTFAKKENCFETSDYIVANTRSEERIYITDKNSSLSGFSDYNGNIVIDCIYDSARDFEEGYSIAFLKGKAGVIDRAGKTIIPFEYDDIEWECRTNAFILIKNDIYQMVSRNRQEYSRQYAYIGSFSFERAIVITSDSRKAGFIDNTGKEIIPAIYDKAEPFINGIATVWKEGKPQKITIDGILI